MGGKEVEGEGKGERRREGEQQGLNELFENVQRRWGVGVGRG